MSKLGFFFWFALSSCFKPAHAPDTIACVLSAYTVRVLPWMPRAAGFAAYRQESV